jgi:hypothetical protein
VHDAESLKISVLLAAAPVLRRAALRAWLHARGTPAAHAHVRDLDAACMRGHGEVWLSAGLGARTENGVILRLYSRT